MRRVLIVLVILVIAALLLLPPVFGGIAKDRFDEAVQRSAEQAGEAWSVALVDYEKGWFSSTGTFRMRMSDEFLDANPLFAATDDEPNPAREILATGIAQEVDIAHGPLILGESTSVGFGEIVTVFTGDENPTLTEFLAKTGNEYYFKSVMTVGLIGSGDAMLDAPGFNVETDNGTAVEFGGIEGEGTFNAANTHVDMAGSIGGLKIEGEQGAVIMEPGEFDVDMAYPEHAPYGLGDAQASIASLTIANPGMSIDMDTVGVEMHAVQSDGNADHVDISVIYEIDQVSDGAFKLADFEFGFGLSNINGPALMALQQASNSVSMNPEDPSAAIGALTDPLYDVLAGGAILSLDPVKFNFNDQAFDASLTLATKTANLPERTAFSFDNPLMFINLFKVDLDLLVNKGLATQAAIPQLKQQLMAGIPEGTEVSDEQLQQMAQAQAPMMLSALVGQGFLKEDGDNYHVVAQYDNGAVTVNGNPIPLGAIMGGGQPQN